MIEHHREKKNSQITIKCIAIVVKKEYTFFRSRSYNEIMKYQLIYTQKKRIVINSFTFLLVTHTTALGRFLTVEIYDLTKYSREIHF